MGNLKYFLICSLIATIAQFSNAGIIEKRALNKAELYYRVHPRFGGPKDIPLSEVTQLHIQGPIGMPVHGYIADPDHDSISPVTHALMASGQYNVIVANWASAASLTYPQSRALIADVGYKFHQILAQHLPKLNYTLADVFCFGHSLGAHVCGNVGKASNGTLGTIVGMDPAGPLIKSTAKDCLSKTDAKRVRTIHTSNNFGTVTPLGTFSLFVHYGRRQPGCKEPMQLTDLVTKTNDCNHNRACQITAESILAPYLYPAVRCDYAAIDKRTPSKCLWDTKVSRSYIQDALFNHTITPNTVFFNPHIREDIVGTFITTTHPRAPYGMGDAYVLPDGYA